MNNKYSVYYDGDGYYFKIGDELTKSIGDVVNAMIEDIKGEGKFVDVEFVDEIYKLIFTLYDTDYFFFCDPSLDKFVGNTSKNLVFEQLMTTFLEELYNTLTEIKKDKGKVIVKENMIYKIKDGDFVKVEKTRVKDVFKAISLENNCFYYIDKEGNSIDEDISFCLYEKKLDWEVDTKVWAVDSSAKYVARHFSHYRSPFFYCWVDGKTSHTTSKTEPYKYVYLAK
jgi:hypothetical protein